MKMTNEGIAGYDQTRYLTGDECNFEKTEGGFLSLRVGEGEEYPRIYLARLFPFRLPDEYISVRDMEHKEIGIIRDVKKLPAHAQELVQEELAKRYFVPTISSIDDTKEEFGYLYVSAQTSAGPRRFTMFDLGSNIIKLGGTSLLLIDVDGNRYRLPDYTTLDKKAARHINIWV